LRLEEKADMLLEGQQVMHARGRHGYALRG
jgi:hypothetical protein